MNTNRRKLDSRRLNARKLDHACLLAAHGIPDEKIAQVLHMAKDTLVKWRNHPTVEKRLKKARECPEDEVEKSLYLRAIGVKLKKVHFYEDQPIEYVEEMAPDVGACIAWLANRRPDKWKRNPNGNHIDQSQHVHIQVTADELKQLSGGELTSRLREIISQEHGRESTVSRSNVITVQ